MADKKLPISQIISIALIGGLLIFGLLIYLFLNAVFLAPDVVYGGGKCLSPFNLVGQEVIESKQADITLQGDASEIDSNGNKIFGRYLNSGVYIQPNSTANLSVLSGEVLICRIPPSPEPGTNSYSFAINNGEIIDMNTGNKAQSDNTAYRGKICVLNKDNRSCVLNKINKTNPNSIYQKDPQDLMDIRSDGLAFSYRAVITIVNPVDENYATGTTPVNDFGFRNYVKDQNGKYYAEGEKISFTFKDANGIKTVRVKPCNMGEEGGNTNVTTICPADFDVIEGDIVANLDEDVISGEYSLYSNIKPCATDGTFGVASNSNYGKVEYLLMENPDDNPNINKSSSNESGYMSQNVQAQNEIFVTPINKSKKGGYLWLRVTDAEGFYPGNSGEIVVRTSYEASEYVNAVSSDESFSGKIINFVNRPLDKAKDGIIKGYANSATFGGYVKALVLVCFTIYAAMYVMGIAQINQASLIINFVKMVIVLTLIQPNSADLINEYILDGFENGTTGLTNALLGTQTSYSNPFLIFENYIKMLFKWDNILRITSLLFFSVFGWFILFIVVKSIEVYLKAMFKVFIFYIIAKIMVSFLGSIAPLMLSFMLFKYTAEFTKQWFKWLLRYTIEPVVMLAAVSVLHELIIIQLYGLFSYSACFKCAVPILNGGYIMQLISAPSGVSQFFSDYLFCIKAYIPFGYDPIGGIFSLSNIGLIYSTLIKGCLALIACMMLDKITNMIQQIMGRLVVFGFNAPLSGDMFTGGHGPDGFMTPIQSLSEPITNTIYDRSKNAFGNIIDGYISRRNPDFGGGRGPGDDGDGGGGGRGFGNIDALSPRTTSLNDFKNTDSKDSTGNNAVGGLGLTNISGINKVDLSGEIQAPQSSETSITSKSEINNNALNLKNLTQDSLKTALDENRIKVDNSENEKKTLSNIEGNEKGGEIYRQDTSEKVPQDNTGGILSDKANDESANINTGSNDRNASEKDKNELENPRSSSPHTNESDQISSNSSESLKTSDSSNSNQDQSFNEPDQGTKPKKLSQETSKTVQGEENKETSRTTTGNFKEKSDEHYGSGSDNGYKNDKI